MPKLATDYTPERVVLARRTCLHVAARLGDCMPEVRIVGGLVPSLLIPSSEVSSDETHLGTLDVDLGLSIALLDEERYKSVSERLRDAGFEPDVSDKGNPTRQRWRMMKGLGVTMDFLIAPLGDEQGNRLRDLEKDFAAVVTPGLHLAFRDFERVELQDETLLGEEATRDVWISGPGAFIVLKALAFRNRAEEKDAYDLYYVIKHFGRGVDDVCARFVTLLDDEHARRALATLRQDFSSPRAIGPVCVARFLTGGADVDICADVFGFVSDFLKRCG